MARRFSITYATFKPLIQLGSRLFYKRFQIAGREDFPKKNEATIVISNHQNGMMDPLMCCAFTPRQLNFLTRADLFKNPKVSAILHHLNMLPIYRQRDKVENQADRNEAIFLECYQRLNAGDVIALFPEGNHQNQKNLRTVKKGIARIVFGTMDNVNPDLKINLVAIGLDYTRYTRFRGDLLLNFSNPVDVSHLYRVFKEDSKKGIEQLLQLVKETLENQIIHIDEEALHHPIERSRWLYEHLTAGRLQRTLADSFRHYKTFSQQVQKKASEDGEWKVNFTEASENYRQELKKIKLHPEDLERVLQNQNSKYLLLILLIITSPLAAIGILLNLLPGLWIHDFAKTKVRDPHFKSSALLFTGIFLLPIFWLITGTVLSIVFSNWLLLPATFVIAFVTGFAAVKWNEYMNQMKAIFTVVRSQKKNEPLWSARNRLAGIIKSI